jgi:hypothetical protein
VAEVVGVHKTLVWEGVSRRRRSCLL